jgi:hypothetical protein
MWSPPAFFTGNNHPAQSVALRRRRHLQQVCHQVAEAAPLLIGPLLEALVELPVGGHRDPLWASSQQIGRARGTKG